MGRVLVNLPVSPYDIVVEPGALGALGRQARAVAPHAKALLAVDSNIAATHGEAARRSLEDAGFSVTIAEIVADEREKTLATARRLYDAMLGARLERRSPVIAVGGGVVGDVAGFAAATYLRGVPLIQVPTTLLAMVDASIGGKTGVNIELPGGDNAGLLGEVGKNLIGSFWQPRIVIADPLVLSTLPQRDFRCGLAECVKHGMIASVALLTFLADRSEAIQSLDGRTLQELIEMSAAIKAGIVEEDEREAGRRALLNLGHTFAHVIEPIRQLDLRHGEAVSIGLAAAAAVAVARAMLTPEERRSILDLLEVHGLPVRLPREAAPPAVDHLLAAMQYDKKVADGRLRLILPQGLGDAAILEDVAPSLVRDAWREVGAR